MIPGWSPSIRDLPIWTAFSVLPLPFPKKRFAKLDFRMMSLLYQEKYFKEKSQEDVSKDEIHYVTSIYRRF
jgi:hypothetical protein